MTIETMTPLLKPVDAALRERAARVIPGGMYGHLNVTLLPASYPQFYRSGDGARLTDVDGNEYIDFMCGFGPMISGYKNPVVEAAAAKQLAEGDALGGPTPRMVELAELLVETVGPADWAMFGKNGTDATSLAVTIARAATGKRKILKGTTAYHGANAWFNPNPLGSTPEDRANIIFFEFNDVASLEAAAAEAGDDLAGVIVSPFKHDGPADDQRLAEIEFARAVRALADRNAAVLIMDEVRTGFRLVTGNAWEPLGIAPDLIAYSKAIANGYALSAVVGIDSLAKAASDIYATGSFWYSGVAMAAAIANIGLLRETDSPAYMDHVGTLFRTGLQAQAEENGFDIVQSGPAVMPYLRFVGDTDFSTALAFSGAAAARGVLLHPVHNWFLSTAHTEADIAEALERTADAFAETRSIIG
jgi:glutamate-1-semialdehyde 2,1-aminomutase